jgi:aminoglycoside phosphotransferase (APT) family kinase protein
MTGREGEPAEIVGRGRTADVLAFGDGRVVKLLHPGRDPGVLTVEASKTRAAHLAGVPAPGVHDEVTIDGRFGVVFDRVDGELMLDRIRRRLWEVRSHARLLAELHIDVHRRSSSDLPSQRERLAAKIEEADGLEPAHRRAALDRLSELGDGDAVLHGDFHPANVILAAEGPVVIDWIDASRGDQAGDVARTLWLLSSATIPHGTPGRSFLVGYLELFRRRYRVEYLRRSSVSPAVVEAWRLPVVAGRLSEGIEHEFEAATAEIRRLVRRSSR